MEGSLYLAGIKHSGKTTLGRLLARHLDVPFYDADDLTVSEARSRGAKVTTPRELYATAGPEEFRDCEAAAMQGLLTLTEPAPRIVALGGGIIDNREALAPLSTTGYLVYLAVEARILFERIMRRGKPAFLTSDQPFEEFLLIYERRDRAYRALATTIVDVDGLSIEEALTKLLEEWRRLFPGWK